jgi:hypothetical protein
MRKQQTEAGANWSNISVTSVTVQRNRRSNATDGPTQQHAGGTNSTQVLIRYTASSMRYTRSVALDRLLRWTVCCVGPSVALDRH